MALRKFTCNLCDKSFEAGDWECPDGRRHQVASKTYYSLAGNWRTYVSEERVRDLGDGRKRVHPARSVQFEKGIYTTADPEDQYALDIHPGLCSAETWKEKFIDKEERLAMKERELAAKEQRLAKQENDLLAKAKEQTKR